MTPTQTMRGFTLVEVLVVVLIIGLFIGLASTVVQPDERSVLRVEAERLAQLLDLAMTESQLTGKAIEWTADGGGYRFWRQREDAGWSEIRDGSALRARTLPHNMVISSLRVDAQRPQSTIRLDFVPYGPPLSFSVELVFGQERYVVMASPLGQLRAVQASE
jgi:general secretion pathway protein H